MRTGGLLVLLAVTVAAGPAVASAQAAPAPGCHAGWPVVAHRAGGEVVQLAPGSLPVACATETGYATSESTLAVTNTGAIFYSPAHTENSMARSVDGGASWDLTYPPKIQYTSLWNTVDPIVTVDRRTGRLFWLRATGDLRTFPVVVEESPLGNQAPTAIAYAHGFQVYSSADDGRNWTTADYQHEFTGDWEKIFVGPPASAASGAPQPTGYPDVVYVCANAPFEVRGPGRACYRSLDGGSTFHLTGYVYPSPSAPAADCPALAGNSGVVDSAGTVYEPQACSNGSYLAVSQDEGASYSWLPIRGAPAAGSVVGGAIPVAIDAGDNLYSAWVADDRVQLVVSRDHGHSWSDPLSVGAPGVHQIKLPALVAGPRGEVGIVYYGSTDKSAQQLTAYITETHDALDARPLFFSGAINDPAHPIYRDYGFNASPRADYVGGGYDASGTLWAGVVKQLGAPDASGDIGTVGYVGRLALPEAGLPAASGCVDTRKFTFRLHHARGARVTRVEVFVNGKRVLRRRGHNLGSVTLKRLPQGTFQLQVVATQSTGSRLVSTRRYSGCTKSRPRTRGHHRRRHR